MNNLIYFAAEQAAQPEGIAALGINLKSFLFQLITFVIVLLILKKFVYGKLVDTLEGRRKVVEDSINHAAKAAEQLQATEGKIAKMIQEARAQADEIVDTGQKEAASIVEAAETKAAQRAEHIVSEAKSQMAVEVNKVRDDLKKETMALVAKATELILQEKLDAKKDGALIERAIKSAEVKK